MTIPIRQAVSIAVAFVVLAAGGAAASDAGAEADWRVIQSEIKHAEKEAKEQMAALRKKESGPERPVRFECTLETVDGASFRSSTFTLILVEDEATVIADDERHEATLDRSYQPRLDINMVRFGAFEFGELLVQRRMLHGLNGRVKIQERDGRGFYNQAGSCVMKPWEPVICP